MTKLTLRTFLSLTPVLLVCFSFLAASSHAQGITGTELPDQVLGRFGHNQADLNLINQRLDAERLLNTIATLSSLVFSILVINRIRKNQSASRLRACAALALPVFVYVVGIWLINNFG